MLKLTLKTIFFSICFSKAYAYLGPGVAGGIITAALGIFFAILAAIFGLLWFPLKRFFKKSKEKKNKEKKN